MNRYKKFMIFFLAIVAVIALALGGFLLYGTLTDYKPNEQELVFDAQSQIGAVTDSVFHMLTWNIGYAGLGDNMDFFYDGGTMVRSDKDRTESNLDKITSFISESNDVDFFLFQEVDIDSKRSYAINEQVEIANVLPNYENYFAPNYKVKFVPLPFSEPMGRVFGGLVTYSKYETQKVVRHSFPGNYSWPIGLFMLDRCFMVNRYKLSSGYELLVINTHNSAYDDGSLRSGQMEFLKGFLLNEYQKGNYVIVGGDWNQCPPNMTISFDEILFDKLDYKLIPADYLEEGWKWVFDSTAPTNRRLTEVYNEYSTPRTVLDYFLVSPNVESVSVQTIDLNFEYSDHNPVKASFKLK